MNNNSLKIEKVRQYLLLNSEIPILYKSCLYRVKIKESPNNNSYTDGLSVYLSKDLFIGDFFECCFVVLHEITHILFFHVFKMIDNKYVQRTWNIACDLWVNNFIIKHISNSKKICYKVPELVFKNKMDGLCYNLYSVEEIYFSIKKTNQNKVKNYNFDLVIGEESKEKFDYLIQKIFDDINEVSDNLCEIFVEQYNINKKTSWLDKFSKFLKGALSSPNYKFERINRNDRRNRSDFFIFDKVYKKESQAKILICLDVSGSVVFSSDIFDSFVNQIYSFSQKKIFDLICFDNKIVSMEKNLSKFNIKEKNFSGGGGTSFDVVFDYLEMMNLQKKYNYIIFFTDGISNISEKNKIYKKYLIWLTYYNEKILSNFGKVILIEKN